MTKPLIFGFYGETKNVSLAPHLLTRSLLAQRILLSIRKGERCPVEIDSEIGADERYVVDELSWLSKNALVKKTDGNRWIANFIVLNKEEKKPLVDIARRLSQTEASIIKEELQKLKIAFEKCSFHTQGFSWSQMGYIILAALIADLGVNYSLHRKDMVPSPPERLDGGRWYFWGLEEGAESKRQFGVNSNSIKGGGTAHIWSWLVKKPTTSPFESDEIAIMLALDNQPLKTSDISKATKLDFETVERKIKKLSTYGYFSKTKERIKPNFPIFDQADLKIMTSEITRISDFIVDNIIKSNRTVFQQLFERLELPKLNCEYGAYLCMVYHMIMDHVLDRLVENGILPEMPRKTSATWGFLGWRGKLTLLDYISLKHKG